MLLLRVTFVATALLSLSPASAQVNIIQAPSNFQFVDMGYDATNDEVAIVGQIVSGSTEIPTIFEPNATNDDFTTQTLANLPGATSNAGVNGISSDASRIAGISSSPNTATIEGVTWLRSNPANPTGIGFVQGGTNSSSATAAWEGGVVGDSSGATNSIIWTPNGGIEALPGTLGFITSAFDINLDGTIIVGFSTHEVFGGAAYFWDDTGINRLDDNVAGFTTINSYARNISPDGNYIGGDILLLDTQGDFLSVAVVWEGIDRTLRVLQDNSGNLIQGIVSDVSNLGIAVGSFFDVNFDAFGFIWQSSLTSTPLEQIELDTVTVFEDWLELAFPKTNFPFETINVGAIASSNTKLFFTAVSATGQAALVDVVVGTTISADGLTVFRGIQTGGTVADLSDSDDVFISFNPGFIINSSEAPIWLLIDATLPIAPTTLGVEIESQANTPGLEKTTEAFNFVTDAFDIIDHSDESFNSDSIVSVDISANASDYVQAGSNAVTVRLGWRQAGFTLLFPWEARVDRMAWNIAK